MSRGAYFKVRVGVVLIQENQLLLVRQNHRDFWVLPGGTQEPDESMAACAVREMKEETNLDVHIEKLLYVADFMTPDRHVIDVFFQASAASGKLRMETTENLNDIGFFTLETFQAMTVKPEPVKDQLLIDWREGFFNEAQYLGAYTL